MSLTPQFQAQARVLWNATIVDQTFLRIPLFNAIIERNKDDILDPATGWQTTVRTAQLTSTVVEYGDNTTLPGGQTTTLETAVWYPRQAEVPLEIPCSIVERGKGPNIIHDPKQTLVQEGQYAMKRWFSSMLYRAYDASGHDGSNVVYWQGIEDALHSSSLTYGGLARATTVTRPVWNGGSVAGTFTDIGTACSPTIDTWRGMYDCASRYSENPAPENYVGIMGPDNWRYLRSQVEASVTYSPGKRVKYGVQSFYIDDIEYMSDPYLSTAPLMGGTGFNTKSGLLNLKDFKLKLSPMAGWGKMLDWTDLRTIPGARPIFFSRGVLMGAFFCTQPNSSVWKTNMS